jgi:hypothetical protein
MKYQVLLHRTPGHWRFALLLSRALYIVALSVCSATAVAVATAAPEAAAEAGIKKGA